MDSFAFIIHPVNPKRDVSRKFPFLGKHLSEPQINFFSTFFPPIYISEIQGIRSASTGVEVRGWFVACPLTPQRMLELPEWLVYQKIIRTGEMAERLGAKILGLGAFTSVIGDAGITIARRLAIPTTTGDAYTISVAIQSLLAAAARMEISLEDATCAVVGATGAIGSVCSEILAAYVPQLYLIGRRKDALEELRSRIEGNQNDPSLKVTTSTNLDDVQHADLTITVSSSINALVFPDALRPGSVVCDVARPRDVSFQVAAVRDDVLVIDGGMVDVPGDVNFNFDFGFPLGKAYACMAETMALALEGRYEDYTLGKQIERTRVEEITEIASRHGFRVSGFRSFEREVTGEMIAQVRENAQAKKTRGNLTQR